METWVGDPQGVSKMPGQPHPRSPARQPHLPRGGQGWALQQAALPAGARAQNTSQAHRPPPPLGRAPHLPPAPAKPPPPPGAPLGEDGPDRAEVPEGKPPRPSGRSAPRVGGGAGTAGPLPFFCSPWGRRAPSVLPPPGRAAPGAVPAADGEGLAGESRGRGVGGVAESGAARGAPPGLPRGR